MRSLELRNSGVSTVSTQGDITSYTTGVDEPLPGDVVGELFKLDGLLATSDGVNLYKYARLDASGDLVAEIVPRTDTLAQLLLTQGSEGELASATDADAIVKFTGQGQIGGAVFRASGSTLEHEVNVINGPVFSVLGVSKLVLNCTVVTASPQINLADGVLGQELEVTISNANPVTSSISILTEGHLNPERITIPFDNSKLSTLKINLIFDGDRWALRTPLGVSSVFGISLSNKAAIMMKTSEVISIGEDNLIAANYTAAIGNLNNVVGISSKVTGSQNTTSGAQSVVMGNHCDTGPIINLPAPNNTASPWEFTMPDSSFKKIVDVPSGFCSTVHADMEESNFCSISAVGNTLTVDDLLNVMGDLQGRTDILLYDVGPFGGVSLGPDVKNHRSHQVSLGLKTHSKQCLGLQVSTVDATPATIKVGTNTSTIETSSSRSALIVTMPNSVLSGELQITARIQGTNSVAVFKRKLIIVDTNDVITIPEFSTVGTDFIAAALTGITVNTPAILSNAVSLTVTGLAATNIDWNGTFVFDEIIA